MSVTGVGFRILCLLHVTSAARFVSMFLEMVAIW